MQQQGCSVSGVGLFYEQQKGGSMSRELRATQDLAPGDVLITVPLASTIHYIDEQQQQQQQQQAAGSPTSSNSSDSNSSSRLAALRRLQRSVPAASDSGRGAWQFKVALEILYHYCQGPASPLHAYIQTLPGVQQGIPKPQIAMLYPKPQLQELQYNPLIGDAASQAYWWRQYSKEVLAALPGSADDPFGGQLVTQEQLGWALSLAMSRAFGFKRLGGWALVPLVDMANHALASNAEIRFGEDGVVRMMANKQVSAGAPILLKYGSHDNANLLLSYGFVLADNPADTFAWPLDMELLLAAIYQFVGGQLPPSGKAVDGLKTWQRTTLQHLGLLQANSSSSPSSSSSSSEAAGSSTANGQQHQPEAAAAAAPLVVRIGGEPPVSPELLAAVRVVLATERSSVKGKSLEQLGDWQQPLSAAHEALVMKALVGLLTVLYKSFPTSIQADRAQLQQPAAAAAGGDALAAERHATAVQFRLGLKLLLERSTKDLIVRLKELLQQ
ncbi:hypothetical protein OEZ86_012302 [Tetradesmus obliquus]|nr:hypothetical protein OEZ86_012302 [Tetradesmus obliquus]